MKTVMLCIPTLASAGAERFVTELACNLDVMLYKTVVVVTNNLDSSKPFYKRLNDNNIVVIDVSSKSYFSEFKNIVRAVRYYRPIIVHTNVGACLHMLLPTIISGTGARHLFTVHSMGYRIFTGVKKTLMKLSFKIGLIIPVAISDTVKKSMIEAYQLAGDRIECIYNGIDTNIFQPKDRKGFSHKFTYITVGTLYYIKNHELLINAFYIVHQRNPETMLKIIGDGKLWEQISNQIQMLGLSDCVVLEGNQSNIVPYLNRADVYCCTSLVEGLPISVLEAMACQLPVITTPAGGVVDIVKNGENGYIVDYNADKIAERMELLLLNNELRQSLARKSREMATALDIKKCAANYELLYEKYSK